MKRIIYSLISAALVFCAGCGDSGSGYNPSLGDIYDMQLRGAKAELPAGEEYLMGANLLASYDGYSAGVNATTKRITISCFSSVGWFSSETTTLSLPYDSILAYRKTGMISKFLNSAYIVEGNRRMHLLEFNTDLTVGLSGVKLPLTYFLDQVTKHVTFTSLSWCNENWAFNNGHQLFDSEDLKAMPIGFRIRKSRIPFGGYVGCVFNLLNQELTVKVEMEGKEFSAQVEPGGEMTFGEDELGRKLKEGDIMGIQTSASTHKWLQCSILNGGDFTCEVRSSTDLEQ